MGEFGAFHEDVRFGWAEASTLSAELRSTASVLEGQIADRNALGGPAREAWRGKFAIEFDGRIEVCVGDADRLVEALRGASDGLDELARLAREEQDRREYAREWEANSDDGGFLDGVGDFVFGEDDMPPPPPPVEPPTIPVADLTVATREASR
ncbi:MAG: hypothetical protein ACRD0A_16350 [Acidimicrobiales bacterium]